VGGWTIALNSFNKYNMKQVTSVTYEFSILALILCTVPYISSQQSS